MDAPIPEVGTPATVVAIDANAAAYCAALGRAAVVDGRDDARFTWVSSDVPGWPFNAVARVASPADGADAAIAEATEWFAARGRAAGMAWVVGPSTQLPGLGQHLARHGFVLRGQPPGMAVDLFALPAEVAAPAGLTIEEVGAVAALAEWAEVVTAANGQSAAFERLLLDAHAAQAAPGGPLRHFLARLDGRAVGASVSHVAGGVVGLYWVATLPDARRRGVGAAVTLTPLLAARAQGYRVGTLYTTPLGLPVYQRPGFGQYCACEIWTRPA
jgi:hypothetical protein